MRRIFFAATIVLASFIASSSAQAHGGGHGGFHGGGFHGGGFHGGGFHGGGFGGFGHQGFGGFGGFGNRGFGYGGFSGYRGIGYGGLGYRGLGYGGWGYGGYRGFGYGYPYYGYRSYYRPYYGLGFGYGLGYGLGYGGFGYPYDGNYGYGFGYPYYSSYGYGYPYYGGYGGYSGFGGYGYPYSAGYGGYGYGYPAYNVGYSPWYGCYNSPPTTGTTVGIGYPTGPTVGTYIPSGSLVLGSSPVLSSVVIGAPAAARSPVGSATASISASTPPTPAVLQAFLGLKDIHPVSLLPAGAPTGNSPTPVAPAATSVQGISLDLTSKLEPRTQAEHLLKEGDELFRAQDFVSALERYKRATPDLPEALWRQGHALVATHQYDLATRAFKRAIAATDDLGRGGFRLSDLYGAAAATKAEHLESLAGWTAKTNTADGYFLVGLFLNYDNQAARAQKFFQKASQLAGIAGGHVVVFLDGAAQPATSAQLDRMAKPGASPPIASVTMAREV